MKRWVGWVLLAISLFIAFEGYENAQVEVATEELARSVACDLEGGCVLRTERPREVRTDILQRRYAWSTNKGAVHVVCRRELLFAGTWSCVPYPGDFPDRA